jgi:hypothetical protein
MSNVTQLPNIAAVEDGKPTAFAVAYAKWMKARSDVAELENTGCSVKFGTPECEQHEDAMAAASTDEQEAVWEMIRSPAETSRDTISRAQVTQALFLWCDRNGWYNDKRHLLMLQSLVLDLQNGM